MAIIKFFASVKGRMETDEVSIHLDNPQTVQDVLEIAAKKISKDPAILLTGSLLYAVNQEIARVDDMVGDSDEIAVLPPMSGG